MARVQLDSVRKVYEDGHVAVHGASLDIGHGEFVVLVGPSGCGKSTTLRMIAGLESITGGTIRIGDRVVNDVPPKDRDIAMVFQNYALYPHMSVFENMAFGLRLRKLPNEDIRTRVHDAARTLGLDGVLDRKPKALSGGQRQRVALGRAIVRDPAVFLFDEPLSNLDAKLRVQTRTEISKLHSSLGATMVYVTHDQVEAMTMGDRIVVLDGGVIQQVAPPLELYNAPANTFVAGFIGSPAMNLLPGVIESGRVQLDGIGHEPFPPMGRGGNQRVVVGIRPEALSLGVGGGHETPMVAFEARLDVVEPMGNEMVVYATVSGADQLVARVPPREIPPVGTTISLAFDPSAVHLFDASTGDALMRAEALPVAGEVTGTP